MLSILDMSHDSGDYGTFIETPSIRSYTFPDPINSRQPTQESVHLDSPGYFDRGLGMSRYPRSARAAAIKCISCNAPVTQTIDQRYVCVECGEEPIQAQTPDTITVRRNGVRVAKTIQVDDHEPRIEFEIQSEMESPIEFRLTDPIGDKASSSNFLFPTELDGAHWTRGTDTVEYNCVLAAGETKQTEYFIPPAEAEKSRYETEPEIRSIKRLTSGNQSPVESPMWRGGTTAASQAPVPESESEQPPTVSTNGAGTALKEQREHGRQEPASRDLTDSALDSRAGIDAKQDLLVHPDSQVAPQVSVILPTKNEEDGIAECIRRILNGLHSLGVTGEIIVSDDSGDRTPEIARANGARVVEPDKPGYGYAYRYAFDYARGDYIVIGDADTTYDFEELPKLFNLVAHEGADIAIGSRLTGEIKPGAMPTLHRYIGNPLLTKFVNTFYDLDVSDAHSGFRVLRRDALEQMDLKSDGMEFASEMVMEAGAKNLVIKECPITYHERVGEETLDTFRDGWRHVKFMLVNAPAYIFSVPAATLMLAGVLTMMLSIHGGTLVGFHLGTHTMIAGSLLTILGYQIASLAVFSAVAGNPIRKPGDKITRWIQDNFKLEQGATIGTALTVVGFAYLAMIVARWVVSGFQALPFVSWNMVAFTLIVLGIQTIFNSFFMSMLGQTHQSS